MTSTISQREKQVLHLISHEHNSKEIALQLYISEHTVISHRKNLLIKMDVKNTAGLIRRGFETGILQIQRYATVFFILMVMCLTTGLSAQCHPDDYTALRALYLGSDPDDLDGIQSWEYMRESPMPPVGCDLSLLDGVMLNGVGRVDILNFPFEFEASFPTEFALLTDLRECYFGDYYLNDTFPDALLQMTNLEVLSWNAALTGVLPSELTDLSKLEVLILARADLLSPLPDLSSLPLKHLDLSHSEFDEVLPSWLWDLDSLEVLNLNSCNFQGGIPDQIENLTILKELGLASNQLKGRINPKIGTLGNLEILSLNNNQFYGTLPSEIGSLSNLTTMSISNNHLSGGIPKEWATLSKLTSLTLYNNQLSGCFHPDLTTFCGTVQIARLGGDIGNNFDASWDDFCSSQQGQCDCEIGDWNGLRGLYNDLDGDNWNTAVSNNWAAVKNNVTMPGGFDKTTLFGIGTNAEGCVDSIRIRNKNLTGVLPDELREINALRVLNLSKNNISGSLPDTLGGLPYLEDLRLNDNQLIGSIYTDGFASLNTLLLNNNNLTGEIPNDISKIYLLEQFGAGGNNLSGTLPPGLSELENLNALRLDSSGLSGCFLPSLSSLCTQLTDVLIDDGNSFDDSWANYCASGAGSCADCNNHYVEWEGKYDNNWTKDYNWSTYCVPTLMDTVVIDNSAEVTIPRDAFAYAAQVGIEKGNKLWVDNGSELNVSGGSTVCLSNNGEVVIEGSVLLSEGPSYSLVNNGLVFIYAPGLLKVSDGGGIGIYNTSEIDNLGTILIRDMYVNPSEDQIGFVNTGDTALFTNDGILEIRNVYDIGFYNFTGATVVIEKFDDIIINGVLDGGGTIQAALLNIGDFSNEGNVQLSNYALNGLHNYSIFSNESAIDILTVPSNGVGLLNEGLFTNRDAIAILQSDEGISQEQTGIINKGIFLNHKRISSTSLNAAFVAIHNEDTFFNAPDTTGAGFPDINIYGGIVGIENDGLLENTRNIHIENCEIGFSNTIVDKLMAARDPKKEESKSNSANATIQFINYVDGAITIDSCEMGLINGGVVLNGGAIEMEGNTQAIQNGRLSGDSGGIKEPDNKDSEKQLSTSTDVTFTNESIIQISGGETGIVNVCGFFNEGSIGLLNVKLVGFDNLDTFYNSEDGVIEVDGGGYNFFENPDSLPIPTYSIAFKNGTFESQIPSHLLPVAHNVGEINIYNWEAVGVINTGRFANEGRMDIGECAGGIVNGGTFYNTIDSDISISDIHGYGPFGIQNIEAPYAARLIQPSFENEGFISISQVSVTKVLVGVTENRFGVAIDNRLPFFNKGYLSMMDSESGLYNYGEFVNDSIGRGITIFRMANDTTTFALSNESLGSIDNYGFLEVKEADNDGVSNAGSIINHTNGTLLLQSIGGRSWLQKDGGYLHNQPGSELEIFYYNSDGSPLEVESGGLIDGYSEISITEIQE